MSDLDIDGGTLDNLIQETDKPVLVDLWALWCGPCRVLGPIVAEYAASHADTVKVVKIDVDASPDVAEKYSVGSIPTLLLFKNGGVTARQTGAMNKAQLEKFVESGLAA
jgi:thioredoxin 1